MNKLKLFPSENFIIELKENSSMAITELKRNTDITNSFVSERTNKTFRGQISDNEFKIISSEIGRGAFCVLTGKLNNKIGEIEIQIHRPFKYLLSILMLLPLIGFAITILTNETKILFENIILNCP